MDRFASADNMPTQYSADGSMAQPPAQPQMPTQQPVQVNPAAMGAQYMGFNFQLLVTRVLKYVIEGGAVALAAYLIPQRKMNLREIVMIALTAAAVFAILDLYAPMVGSSARFGTGFGLGAQLVGWPAGGAMPPMV